MICNYNQATLLDSKTKPQAVSLGRVVDKNHFTYLLKKKFAYFRFANDTRSFWIVNAPIVHVCMAKQLKSNKEYARYILNLF